MTDQKQHLRKEETLRPTSYTEVTRIHRGALSKTKGSIVITSTEAGEGATLTAQLMAMRSAENGEPTLLIDLNMFNADITKEFKLDRNVWSLASRNSDDTLADLITQAPHQENLFVMAAPADESSAELLKDPHRAAHFFNVVERQFNHVVVDTTPILATNRRNADSIILASAARRCALVMMAGVTAKSKVKQAIKSLRESGANIEGVVVNDYKNPSIKDRVQALVNCFMHIAPSFHSWLTYRVQRNKNL
jgi:Mrp family chromosome partitioning ATPase